MSDNDVLSQVKTGNPDPVITDPAPESADSVPSVYAEFIGEDKKYKTVSDALNSIPHAQQHIANLEAEKRELREELEKRLTAEEILKRVEARSEGDDTNQPELDKDAIAQLVAETVHTLDVTKIAEANRQKVNDKLIDMFGDSAVNVVNAKAKELGIGKETIDKIASQSPTAFFKMLEIDTSAPKDSSLNLVRTTNTDGGVPTDNAGPKYGTFRYYQELRKSNEREYYSTKVQQQMHKHAAEMGDAFYK